VLRQVRVLEEDDVVVGAGRGDAVPHLLERVVLVVGVERDLEDADLVGLGHVGARERGRELLARRLVARRPEVEHEHPDGESFGHEAR
jgi:hypothetical protein